MRSKRPLLLMLAGVVVCLSAGCAVPQPRGEGLYRHVQEPTTKAWYHLYLPVDYVRNKGRHPNPKVKRWPLVMTFHGMKPYDNALPQEREWEKEADFYGYIVCAPQLATSDSFMEYPLTKEHGYVLRDKRNVIAIMNHVFATWHADPKRVLSTSWSCGGYLAHYFPNRFPDKFTCIATRLSNFSPKLMIEETVPSYKDRVSVAVFIGDGDFPACKTESEDAVAWYTARKFRTVRGKMIDRMGHRRIPQVAAAFFAEQIGIEPLRPLEAGKTVAQVQMTDYYPPQKLIAEMSQRSTASDKGDAVAMGPPSPPTLTKKGGGRALPRIAHSRTEFVCRNAGRNYPSDRTPLYDPTPEHIRSRTSRRTSPTVPPTGAGATRVAMNPGSSSNWLEPTGGIPRRNNPPAKNKSSGCKAGDRPIANRRGAAGEVAPDKTGSAQSRRDVSTNPGTAKRSRPGSTRDATQNKRVPANPSRRFNPQDAGPRDYDRRLAMNTPKKDVPVSRRLPKTKAPVRSDGNQSRSTTSAEPQTKIRRSRAKPVHVRLSGPAIGTAPHYIAYSVELPRGVLDGADCLWMDNGVWIGDEPRGVKILESPGLHRIAVLIVTKRDVEYRGSAVVHVLEPGRAGSPAIRKVSGLDDHEVSAGQVAAGNSD